MKSLICALLVFFSAVVANAAITLEGTTDSLEIVTSAAGSIDYDISWSNVTATALTTPGTNKGNIATATTTTVVSAPSASNWRYIRTITVYNASTTASNSITVQKDVSATNRLIAEVNLGPGEYAVIDDSGKLTAYTTAGNIKTQPSDQTGFKGITFWISKVATAFDTVGYHYLYNKGAGSPGAMSLQTPGLGGFFTDCSIASQATDPNGAAQIGSPKLNDPTGAWYLTKFGVQGAVAGNFQLIDLLWYNTGAVVTTTTGQTVNSGTLPSRDLNGTSNGDGVRAALYALTTAGAAAAIANTTITYTDQDGNTGNTGTFDGTVGYRWPVGGDIGTWAPFQLAAGDTGIRSIQTLTLGTSYVSGTLSLMMYRPLAMESTLTANTGSGSLTGQNGLGQNPGVRVYNGSCLSIVGVSAPATTLNSINAIVQLMDR